MNNLKQLVIRKLDLEFTYPKVRSEVEKQAISFAQPKVNTTEIDIIMPTFNRVRETERCIRNLYKVLKNIKFRLIIIDNNSNHDTLNYLKDLETKEKNIKVIYAKENLGGSGSRNLGLKEVRTEFVAFLDNDIFIMPGYFEQLLSTIEENSEITAVQSKVITPNRLIQINRPYYLIEDNWVVFSDYDLEKEFDDSSTFESKACNWIPSGATLWRSKIFEKETFDTTLGTYYEDNEFSFRLNKKGHTFSNNHKALCLHYSSNFAPDNTQAYIKERFNNESIKQALKKFYQKHKLFLAYGSIEGHVKFLGFNSKEEYTNFLKEN